jgi:hypothetical protein
LRTADEKMHHSAVASGGELGGSPAYAGLDARANVHLIARDLVIGFRVVAGVGVYGVDRRPPGRFFQHWCKVRGVASHSRSGYRRQDHMRRYIRRQHEFGRSARRAASHCICRGCCVLSVVTQATLIVPTAMVRVVMRVYTADLPR